MSKLWPFVFNLLQYASIAAVAPFVVLYYQELGFTGTQIGLLTGISPLVTVFSTPLWTGLADASGRHRLIVGLGILVSALTEFLFPFLSTFVPVLLVAVLLYIFVAPVTPLADSAAMFMLADKKEMYSRVRLGGTIGFGLAAPFAGILVQRYGLRYAFWSCAGLLLLAFFISQKLVYGQAEADGPGGGRVRTLLSQPRWILFLVLAFAAGAGLAAFNNYLFPYMGELGASESLMGFTLTVGILSEIPVLYFGNRLITRFKPYGLLMLSLVVTGLRMLLYAASVKPGFVLVAQLLNGLTFAATWVAGVAYADENAPAGMSATAQGLFSTMVLGVGMAVGGFVGGPLLERMGGSGLYLVFGAAVLAIVALVALVERRLPAEQRVSPVS
jgi:PPP family 3-phenylpropionic acid transporter